jgi:hypothetical protein
MWLISRRYDYGKNAKTFWPYEFQILTAKAHSKKCRLVIQHDTFLSMNFLIFIYDSIAMHKWVLKSISVKCENDYTVYGL